MRGSVGLILAVGFAAMGCGGGRSAPPDPGEGDVHEEADGSARKDILNRTDIPNRMDVPIEAEFPGETDVATGGDLVPDPDGGCGTECGAMVVVPEGPFVMGCAKSWEWSCNSMSQERHQVTIPSFKIDKYEVTVGQYRECVDAGTCTLPDSTPWCNWGLEGREQYPADCLDWYQAREYCEWTGRRLCSEAEWEKAARGTDERAFPWGNTPPSCQYAVMDDGGDGCGAGSAWPVGSKPAGASPYGAMDLVGNAAEWVQDWRHENYEGAPTDGSAWEVPASSERVARGGSFAADIDYSLLSWYRVSNWPSWGRSGARCCVGTSTGPEIPLACTSNCGEMVPVPAGPFMMGCNETWDSECEPSEKPYHEVVVPSFEIDKFEVTVSQYRACIDAGRCAVPVQGPDGTNGNLGLEGHEQHPANFLDWYQAREYCEWAGKRLCSEAEWEKAARGTDGRIYPWGNETPSCRLAVMVEDGKKGCGANGTMPVGSKPAGASPYGALDMAGSVNEWVQDWYRGDYAGAPTDGSAWGGKQDPNLQVRVLRSSDHMNGYTSAMRASMRDLGQPKEARLSTGARCCRTAGSRMH